MKKYWGHEHFRPRQEDIISSVIAGRDTMALLPTGGGKSICFQVPALCMEGLCLVISPLLALMFDQVENLRKKGISAHAVNSAMSSREMDRVLDNCVYGSVKFLYVSPERIKNELFIERFRKMKINMIAVDEAHCISQWGYDFRPDYLKIADIRTIKPDVPVLALTASATPVVVSDIQQKLAFPTANVIGTGFGRANLSYNVSEQENKETKILEICLKMKGSGIVYCGSRLRTREITQLLSKRSISAAAYNAGLSAKERDIAYKNWMNNSTRIICATNAFGMGIDKPDVRFVIHADMPAQPEAYFQEAGRVGRDGQKAYAILLYNSSDVLKISKQIDQKYPPKDFIRGVYKSIGNYLQLAPGAGMEMSYAIDMNAFCKGFGLRHPEVVYALYILELAGYLRLSDVYFMPSRLFLRVSRQDLYSYQVVNPSMDPLIKVILRMYGGLFEQYVNIREDDIARHSQLALSDILAKLKILHQQNVIDYSQQSELPKVTFLTGRMHEDNLVFPPDVYENRKLNELKRANAMEKYISRKRCRSIQLLEYFGEKNTPVCGICDICRENTKHGLQPDEYEKLNALVIELVMTKKLTVDQLPEFLPGFTKAHVIEYTRWKIDTGELILNDKLFLTLPGMENE